MSAAERSYRLLLRAYPAGFRDSYGREMLLVFRAQRRGADGRGSRFWARLLWDVLRSAPALRWEAARSAWEGPTLPEGAMKTMGVFAVIVGVLEAAAGLSEGWLGGVRRGDPHSIATGVLGPLAGVALVMAGVALARRSRRFVAATIWGASICLAAFAIMLLTGGRLSVAATALGVLFPLALLVFVGVRGRGGPSVRAAAPMLLLLLALPMRASAQTPGAPPAAAAAKDLPLTAAERQAYIGTYDVTLPGGMVTSFTVFEEKGVLKGSVPAAFWLIDTESAESAEDTEGTSPGRASDPANEPRQSKGARQAGSTLRACPQPVQTLVPGASAPHGALCVLCDLCALRVDQPPAAPAQTP